MATRYWTGAAAPIKQVNSYAFAVTWIIGETITVTYGQKSYVYTITSTSIPVIVAGLVAALNALSAAVYPEFTEQTASGAATPMLLTAKTAGKSFIVTITTNSAAGTITPTTPTPSAGPRDVSTPSNWTGNTLPVSTDTVIVDREGARLNYGLNQSGVVAAVRRITARDVEIGLPRENVDGGTPYPEYRPDYWRMTATSDYVNTNSGRIKLDHGTGQTTYEQDASGSGRGQGVPAVLLKGTHASNSWSVFGGTAGLAYFGGDAARVNVLNLQAGATVTLGIGCVCDTLNNYGGKLTVNSAIATAMNHPAAGGGTTTIEGDGAVAQVTLQSGTCNYNTSGTLGGNTELANNAFLTFDGDQRAKTVTNPILIYSPSAKFSDKNGVIGGGYTLDFANCVGSVVVKPNSRIVVSAL
jgi:hypothetical protein